MIRPVLNKRNLLAFLICAIVFVSASLIVALRLANAEGRADNSIVSPESSEKEKLIEEALFARTEFFGANSIVPYPTIKARLRLAALLEKYPNEANIHLKLAQLDEQLGNYQSAEQEFTFYVELNFGSESSLEVLSAYFHRRAEYEREVATLEKILKQSTGENRQRTFAKIIELAKTHQLENRLKPEFYKQIIAEDPTCFAIIEQLIEKLFEEKNYAEALKIVREQQQSFPEQNALLLEKEIEILIKLGREKEAINVYHRAFDLFWSDEQTGKYYAFLNEQNCFRAYQSELRKRLKQNPTDTNAALRLFHLETKSRSYSSNPTNILINLEKARAGKKIDWQPEELLTVARLLISAGDGDTASRFLYTLFAQNKLEKNSQLRARVLYQLFGLLIDASDERIALTRGDLQFYRDVAASDPHPGITTGILSLIFSDTNPAQELHKKESIAVKLFNRAAAYRIFTVYKQENPASPELAQMYLDIVRIYTAAGEPEVASKNLIEFEQHKEFEDRPEYPEIALKLAEGFVAAKQFEKERAVYKKLLDYLGKKQIAKKQTLVVSSSDFEPTQTKPIVSSISDASDSSDDVSINVQPNGYYDYGFPSKYRDYLGKQADAADYAEILNRYVSSLAREKRTAEILTLYADETRKYPNEAGLYEQMLQWLGQTNIIDEQLEVYKKAIEKFPGSQWHDRLARWFLRQNRQADFENLSNDLIEKLNDAEIASYLVEFIDKNVGSKPKTFDARLYLALYSKAHRRFPHNLTFVQGLLAFYHTHNQKKEWRNLTAEYYFESPQIREQFLLELAKSGELRGFQAKANEMLAADNQSIAVLPYKQFRAGAAIKLSNYEEAVDAYRELNELYPNSPEYNERFVAITRSLGQINNQYLNEAAAAAHAQAEHSPAESAFRTRAGEIQAEIGDYNRARGEWQKIIQTGEGNSETYLEAATIYWDYFQYDEALGVINRLREEKRNPLLYAFEAAAIFEAKHEQSAALAEYIKALDGWSPFAENVVSSDRAKRRLEKLYFRSNISAELSKIFAHERKSRTNTSEISKLVLGYADFLRKINKWNFARQILRSEILKTESPDFLEEARDLCMTAEDDETERFILERLATVASAAAPRKQIQYRFELVQSLSRNDREAKAAKVLSALVTKFPTNYGVLTESADFYWRINRRDEALQVLKIAMGRARGRYRTTFGRKLANRFLEQNLEPAAEQILTELYEANALDYGVFEELTNIYVRTKNRAGLERMFNRTLTEIKKQNIDFREINDQTADLRAKMIVALTRLQDYRAAVAQHIEIINREPENEESIEAAIDYVRRYGGADALLDYYQNTANAAYKNYRWFVVLARIYEANKDFSNAAENYQVAIQNQPEMIELYDALAAIYEKQQNYDLAIQTFDKTLELSNDDPVRLKRLIKLLEKANRFAEANAARQRLPIESARAQTLEEQFAAAENLKNVEKSRAIETYRGAFASLLENPLNHELKAAEIVGYVNALRGAEPLDQISNRIWQLRDKLVLESTRANSVDAGKAREQRRILDAAIIEAIGGTARDFATHEERRALSTDFEKRIETALAAPDTINTLAMLQNISHKAGFGVLEEKILIGQKDAAFKLQNAGLYHTYFNSLINFYREKGDFKIVLQTLEAERARDFDSKNFFYLELIAENARLIGDSEKELAALREYFERTCQNCSATAQPNRVVARYFEALTENGEDGKAELLKLTENAPPAFRLQFINFLIAKNERELVQRAIQNAQFSNVWKLSRQAETSLAFDDYKDENANYFRAALHLKPIGELIGEEPEFNKQLISNDWFRLANSYGKWLYNAKKENWDAFLPAVLENRPSDSREQAKLGRWYLDQKDAAHALEHLNVVLETNPDDKKATADLGTTYFLAGDKQKAFEVWERIIAGSRVSFEDFALYLETLQKSGLAAEARKKLTPILAKKLEDSYSNEDEIKQKIRLLDDSFGDNKNAAVAAEQAAYFLALSNTNKESVLVPETIVTESIVAKNQLAPFYELLIKRGSSSSSFGSSEVDYNYINLLKTSLNAAEAENALDAAENYEIAAPSAERINNQKQFLFYLLEQRETNRAQKLVAETEKAIEKRFARPPWLRLARLQVQLQMNSKQQIIPEFKRFVGIVDSDDARKIIRPSLERLNEAVGLLRAEGCEAESDELQTMVYARLLALEQFENATFVGLANLAFKRNKDRALGLKLLQIMVDLTDPEKKEFAAAELIELEIIKTYAVDSTKLEDISPTNSLTKAETLKIAAEIAAKFEEFDRAIAFRQQLLVFAPSDASNQIALAELLARQQNAFESASNFAAVVTNHEFSRKFRWQALWQAAETFGKNVEFWNALQNALYDSKLSDAELQTAFEVLKLAQTQDAVAAQNVLGQSDITEQSTNLQFLAGLLAKETGQNEMALANLLKAIKIDQNAELAAASNSADSETLRQTIALYVFNNQPRAALKLAENKQILNHKDLLELLSSAAEQIDDFARAAEFEVLRKSRLVAAKELEAAENRIEFLRSRERESAHRSAINFTIDQKNVFE